MHRTAAALLVIAAVSARAEEPSIAVQLSSKSPDIREKAAKARGIYDERAAEQSTGQCWEHRLSLGGDRTELYLECPAGHRIDQDVNAAYNLLYIFVYFKSKAHRNTGQPVLFSLYLLILTNRIIPKANE